MKISNFMAPVQPRRKKSGRFLWTYRAARRNVARIKYRQAKKERKNVAVH